MAEFQISAPFRLFLEISGVLCTEAHKSLQKFREIPGFGAKTVFLCTPRENGFHPQRTPGKSPETPEIPEIRGFWGFSGDAYAFLSWWQKARFWRGFPGFPPRISGIFVKMWMHMVFALYGQKHRKPRFPGFGGGPEKKGANH